MGQGRRCHKEGWDKEEGDKKNIYEPNDNILYLATTE